MTFAEPTKVAYFFSAPLHALLWAPLRHQIHSEMILRRISAGPHLCLAWVERMQRIYFFNCMVGARRRRCWTTSARRAWRWARLAASRRPSVPTPSTCPRPTGPNKSHSSIPPATRSASSNTPLEIWIQYLKIEYPDNSSLTICIYMVMQSCQYLAMSGFSWAACPLSLAGTAPYNHRQSVCAVVGS